MKILLVRPPVPRHTIGLKNIMICEPLELEYAAASLEHHDVMIMDMILEKGFKARLESFNPDVIASSAYISGVNEVFKLFREAKAWNADCITVAGGVQASQVPEDFLDPSVDIIVRGDGTTTMPQIISALENGTSLMEINNLVFPSSMTEYSETKRSNYMPKADDLPLPRRDLVAHLREKYYYLTHRPVATMKTAWGCWYKCNFCYTWRITDGTPYARSPESIIEELLTIEADEVYIVDDIFLIKPSRLRKLADLIKEHNIKKRYLIYARADFISANEEIVKEWAELGLTAVFIGIEATTDSELDGMDKESSVDENIGAIKMLQKYNIDIYGSLIPHPDYTVDDWKRLRKFINDVGLYYVNISPLLAMPGTLIWNEYKDRINVPREAHGLWDLSHTLIEPKLGLRRYYWQLLKTYASVIYNLPRAKQVTQRTLPSLWSVNYWRVLWGSTKIGWQFLNAHRHHSKRELKKAMYRGVEVQNLGFATERLSHLLKPESNEGKGAA